MKFCLPLLPVQQGLLPSLKVEPRDPPRTPYPNRKLLENANGRPTKTPAGSRHHPRVLDFDFDDQDHNKENLPPTDQPADQLPEDEELLTGLKYLLRKWGQELDQFQEKVLQELNGYRRRLGIPS
uniref:E4 protein n=1 Tax=Human papillomavirus TaxID=10566 RepID=H2BQD9_9PAPI|nr:E4 protein [Human papillomavirus]